MRTKRVARARGRQLGRQLIDEFAAHMRQEMERLDSAELRALRRWWWRANTHAMDGGQPWYFADGGQPWHFAAALSLMAKAILAERRKRR